MSRVVPRSHQRQNGGKIIGTRWAEVNKGDAESPNCRSRLVGREFNVGGDDTLYAAPPPLEALRIVPVDYLLAKVSCGVN